MRWTMQLVIAGLVLLAAGNFSVCVLLGVRNPALLFSHEALFRAAATAFFLACAVGIDGVMKRLDRAK